MISSIFCLKSGFKHSINVCMTLSFISKAINKELNKLSWECHTWRYKLNYIGANLWLHFASRKLPDSQFCLESKTEPSMTKAENYIALGGREHCTGKNVYWERGHRNTLLTYGTIKVGTPHNIPRRR